MCHRVTGCRILLRLYKIWRSSLAKIMAINQQNGRNSIFLRLMVSYRLKVIFIKKLKLDFKNKEEQVTKRTLGGTNLKVIRESGFRARMQTKNGKKVIKRRRARGRKNLSISSN